MTIQHNNSNESIVRKAINYTPRKQFVATKLDSLIVGHSISSESIAQKILENITFHSNYKVLHIGTGSGYLTAIISLITDSVLTIEHLPALAKVATDNFQKLHLKNIKIQISDANNISSFMVIPGIEHG